MRIGILTLPFNNNYGGYLQAYALQTVLKRMGYEPCMIMRRHDKPKVSVSYKVKYALKGAIKTILRRRAFPIIYNVENGFWEKGKRMLPFVNREIQPQTPYLYSTNELRKYCEGMFDAYVVGSDQVWRAVYVPDVKNYFLDFTEGWKVKRIAYAASFGTDNPEYTEQQKKQCKKLIEQFDAVSVREKSGLEVISMFGWNPIDEGVVLDPTLLLSSVDYQKLLPQKNSVTRDKVFYYVLDRNESVDNILCKASQMLGKETFGISDIQKGNAPLISIEDWLSNIRDAEFVITDSFHGMVFSIIFHTPFVVCVNKERGVERFLSLLSMLGLTDRMLNEQEQVDKVMKNGIDWNLVDDKISHLKMKSMNFLKQSLI